MSRHVSWTREIELPCPVCGDGEVSVDVVTEPVEYGAHTVDAYAENGQTIACSNGCSLTEEQINDLCSRAVERAAGE